jgi:ABC-type transporter Mla subunit MlaD
MGSFLSIIIELTVVVLLAATVAYCFILDRRLQKLRGDETAMRQTVTDLVGAAERAERSIEAMRAALVDSDRTLGENLRQAEAANAELMAAIRSGDDVMERIGRIVVSAKRAADDLDGRIDGARDAAPPTPPSAPSKLSETLAAAEAFAERARRRILDAA